MKLTGIAAAGITIKIVIAKISSAITKVFIKMLKIGLLMKLYEIAIVFHAVK